MLVKREKEKTKFILPVYFKNTGYRTFFYYSCENDLFKAYIQLKAIKGNIIPFYPQIDDVVYYGV